MTAGKMSSAVALVCKCLGILQLCSAHMRCSVTEDDNQTMYDIPDLSHVDVKASKCISTWTNASDIVIANHLGLFLQPVMRSSFSKLVTYKCIGNITFSATCNLEGRAQDYRARCITTCRPEALINRGIPPSWITAVVVAVIFLVLAGLVGFLCYKYKIWRKCSCGQTGGLYTAAKFQKNDQVTVHVERGK